MRFGLDEDREALRATARALLEELCPPAAVRAAWTRPPSRDVWQALCDTGALGVLVPEADGGLELDETYLAPVVEEAGRVALPHPLTATALVAAPLGVTGQMVATDLGVAPTALTACTSEPAGASVEWPVDDDAAHPIVPAATFAEAFLLCDSSGLRLFEPGEVELAPVRTVDLSRHCARVRRRGDGVIVSDDAQAVAAAFDRGVLGTAAELVGLSRTMLALAVSHVTQRHQFGKPVGAFQAIKHHLANSRLQIEFAAPSVLYAAYSIAHGMPDARRSVSQAKHLANTAASITSRCALQCHGAIGYTVEHDLHLYMKRSWALTRTWGDSRFHADRVAAAIGA